MNWYTKIFVYDLYTRILYNTPDVSMLGIKHQLPRIGYTVLNVMIQGVPLWNIHRRVSLVFLLLKSI